MKGGRRKEVKRNGGGPGGGLPLSSHPCPSPGGVAGAVNRRTLTVSTTTKTVLPLLDEDIKGDSQYPRQCVTAPIRARVRPRKYRVPCKRDRDGYRRKKFRADILAGLSYFSFLNSLPSFFFSRATYALREDGDFLVADGTRDGVMYLSTRYSDRRTLRSSAIRS